MRMKYFTRYTFLAFILIVGNCVDPYNPPALESSERYLVVDGYINSGEGITTFKLSYTDNLNNYSTIPVVPTADVFIESKAGKSFKLNNAKKGVFESNLGGLSIDDQYRLHIIVKDGGEYYSRFEEVKNTPDIDSVFWEHADDGIKINVTTHDPQNSTRYYCWDYVETWKFRVAFHSDLKYVNYKFVPRPPEEQLFECFKSSTSSAISVATSERLSEDIIYRFPLVWVPASNTNKLSVKYSVLIKQYSLTKEGFDYWLNLKKISENLGGFFDPQPATLTGNIYSVEDPSEPVLGYVSGGKVVEKRIFISKEEYKKNVFTGKEGCVMDTIPGNGRPEKVFNPSTIPLYTTVDSKGRNQLFVGDASCADCTTQGTRAVPDFWQ